MNIKEICDYIHNYFEKDEYTRDFTITDGALVLDSSIKLLDNQYYMIKGSVFNDGIYKHPETTLKDEVFKGALITMAVPPDVISLMAKITEWETANKDVLQSPFNSESFGGYSYSKGTSNKKDGSSGNVTWRDVFGDKLKAYRKIG